MNPGPKSEQVEEIHYSAVHTALEQYLDRDIPGSLTFAQYPGEDAEKGYVEFRFTIPEETQKS